jgi:hypothetical protein
MRINTLLLAVIMLGLCGCGIDGAPQSPAYKKSGNNFDALLPFGDQGEQSADDTQVKPQQSYTSIGDLERIGYHYNANFGLENDELEDVFERITPQSGQPRRRAAIMALHDKKQ